MTLSPSGTASEDDVAAAALKLRTILNEHGVEPICMPDGFRGVTLRFPAQDGATYESLASFALEIVEAAVSGVPGVFTHAPLKADRGKRISLGIKSNYPGMGVLLPYAVRGTPGLEIAAPIAWADVGKIRNGDVRVGNFANTFARTGDVFAQLARCPAWALLERQEFRATVSLDAVLAVEAEPGTAQPRDFILQAALAVLADGKAHSDDDIRATAVERGLLHASTTPEYVYGFIRYVMRTLGAGRTPPFVQVEHETTFRLNRPVDAWPDVVLPRLPRWLGDATIEELAGRLITTSTGSEPAAFECRRATRCRRSASSRSTSAARTRRTASSTRRSERSDGAASSNARRRAWAATSQIRCRRAGEVPRNVRCRMRGARRAGVLE